jgi:hypothetical protein
MPKQNDAVQQFTALRNRLMTERAALQKRIQQINAALGSGETQTAAAPAAARKRGRPPGRPPGTPRIAGNALSIREAITKVTARQPLGVRDIVSAVQKIGYKFQSSNPINSVGAYLYGAHGKKHFKRVDGKFKPN